ncbi:MAG: lytic transglycosylase domain-containing protein [Methylotenera sp.]|nr:lytic transglycosylase domain-containing protein [Oligoflexia bacterium]
MKPLSKNTLLAGATLLGVLLVTFLPVAQSAFDRPFSFFNSQFDYFSTSNLLEPTFTRTSFEDALLDSSHRIDPTFSVPPAMTEMVRFWMKVYTEYSTQQLVLFDERHPELIYEVIDLRPLQKSARNAIVYEILSKRLVKSRMAAFREGFRRLDSKQFKGVARNEIEERILKVLQTSSHTHPYSELLRNLRVQTGQRDNVIKGLAAAEPYLPKMEKIFEGMEVPKELTRLSLVESSFNLKATSRVGASGVWQFMPKSATEYMHVDLARHQFDERRSPIKSSIAAAKLLRRNFSSLNDWALAITAYNHGARGMMRFRADEDTAAPNTGEIFQGCDGAGDLKGRSHGAVSRKHKSRLGFASRNYYAEFLAMLHAEAYRDVFYGEVPVPFLAPLRFEKLTRTQVASQVAKDRGIRMDEFRYLNPDIQSADAQLPRGYRIALPATEENLSELILINHVDHTRL